ncbi:glycosyl transferase family 2 [Bacteroidales bacterium]|nr:glycosyl transferase family 2 [Bacteroidales bacterium]
MNHLPLFSVLVCTYNRGQYLYSCLDSIALQDFDYHNFEILIIDNNSPDNTEQVCSDFAKKNPKLHIRYFKEMQQGISFGRNRGVREAKGDLIAFIDDDETIQRDYLSNLSIFFRDYPQASLCGGPVVPIYEVSKPKWLSPFTLRLITGAYDKGDAIKQLKEKDYPGTGHATLRKKLFDKYGLFNTDLGRIGNGLLGAEDKDFFFRLIQNHEPCYYLPTATIYHHIPAAKLTEDFFQRLTFGLGRSERIRTKSLSQKAFLKRLILGEGIKWSASVVLFFYYLLRLEYPKGKKLLQFRYNVARGMLSPNK